MTVLSAGVVAVNPILVPVRGLPHVENDSVPRTCRVPSQLLASHHQGSLNSSRTGKQHHFVSDSPASRLLVLSRGIGELAPETPRRRCSLTRLLPCHCGQLLTPVDYTGMSLQSDIQNREAQIHELDERWSWLMGVIRASKEQQKRNCAAHEFAGEINTALDQHYLSTLDCILECARR